MKFSSVFLGLYYFQFLFLDVTGFRHSPQAINLKLIDNQTRRKDSRPVPFIVQDSQSDETTVIRDVANEFPEQWFTQPLDHFTPDSPTFRQRYWVNMRHYIPGTNGPVIVLDGGETSGEDRLPFLDTGIADILAKATRGIGVVLEHRYYGKSIPVANLTTDSLRWLTNEQALEDSARFMAHVKFDDINEDLTAPNTPWIYYGGSYAGARAAHMRVLYPDLVYGAIASSAVTHASIELWEYMDLIRRSAGHRCSRHLENLAVMIDSMLSRPGTRNTVKTLFGLSALEHDYDFVTTIEIPFESWQYKNWDPAVGITEFDEFCKRINNPMDSFESTVKAMGVDFDDVMALASVPEFDYTLFNYATYVRAKILPLCPKNQTVEQCFGTFDDAKYQDTSLDQDWRLWQFQVCTQWGYFSTSPPDSRLPRIVSRLRTLENESKICHQAFSPGDYFSIPSLPNVTAVNVLGDFSIASDRLAIVDGEVDPWRPMTPHSEYYAHDRPDTISRPFKLIPNGVHHWDENGLENPLLEPPVIQKIHGESIKFVQAWLKDFKRKQ